MAQSAILRVSRVTSGQPGHPCCPRLASGFLWRLQGVTDLPLQILPPSSFKEGTKPSSERMAATEAASQ